MANASLCRGCNRELAPPRRHWCVECGVLPAGLSLHTSTDESRGRALAEMSRTVEAGRAEFDRDLQAGFERDVYEHYRGSI